jgi:hypothetical protein
VRTYQTEEAALLFKESAAEAGTEIRSWAEVKTTELKLPPSIKR